MSQGHVMQPGDGHRLDRRDKRRQRLLGLIVIAMTLAMLAAILEIGLRVAGYSNPRLSQRDDNRGTARIPGVETVYTEEGFGHVRINSAGFRDQEWTVEKPKGTLRIALLGDSYVEALQVEEEQRFAEVMESELNTSKAGLGRRVQVMNFGVSGYGTAQELMTLRHHIWQYGPDLIVLAMTPTNDVRNNSKALEQDDGRPYFQYLNGTLSLDESFRLSPAHNRGVLFRLLTWAGDRSRLVELPSRSLRTVLSRGERQRQIQKAGVPAGFEDEAGLDVWVYTEPRDELKREAWRITEGIVGLMNQEVRSRGVGFLVVTVTSGRQVDPNPAIRQGFMNRLGVTDLFYPEKRIRALGEREGVDVLTLGPVFQEYAERNQVALHGFHGPRSSGHWNAVGHRHAGHLLAVKIAEMWKEHPPAPIGEFDVQWAHPSGREGPHVEH